MEQQQGAEHPERNGGRNRLSVRNPRVENWLAAFNLDGINIEETRTFSNALLKARDDWADQNRFGRRYSDQQEARALGLVRQTGGGR